MKAYLIILLLFPVFCFAQENGSKAAAKPSIADCPTWKKKDKKASKAEYFQYLRTSKPQSKPQPGYTYTSITDSKVRPNTVQTRTKKTEQEEELNNEKEVTSLSSVQNKPAASTKNLKKEEKRPVEPGIEKEEQKKPTETASKEEPQKSEKPDEEKTKLKQKLTRITRKTTKMRKHSNSKCPSF